jgi:hypothetical protein
MTAPLDHGEVVGLASELAAEFIGEDPIAATVLRDQLTKAMTGHETREAQDRAGADVLRGLCARLRVELDKN